MMFSLYNKKIITLPQDSYVITWKYTETIILKILYFDQIILEQTGDGQNMARLHCSIKTYLMLWHLRHVRLYSHWSVDEIVISVALTICGWTELNWRQNDSPLWR